MLGLLSVSASLADNKKAWVYRPGSPDRQLSGVMLSTSGDTYDMVEAMSGDLYVSSTLFLNNVAPATSNTLFLRREPDNSVSEGPIEHGDLPDLDGTYLRLDATNSPVTGALEITANSTSAATLEVNNTFSLGSAIQGTAGSAGGVGVTGIALGNTDSWGGVFVSDSTIDSGVLAYDETSKRHGQFGVTDNYITLRDNAIEFEGTSDSSQMTLGIDDPTDDITYKLADQAAGTYYLAQKTAAETFDSDLTVAGAFTANGNSTIGNASSDTATMNARTSFPNATTTGNSVVLGTNFDLYSPSNSVGRTPDSLIIDTNLTVSGNTALGNASADTVTANARTSWPNATSAGNSLRVGSDVDMYRGTTNQLYVDDTVKVQHLGGRTSAPSIAANTGAGSGGGVSVSVTGHDLAGIITVTTGTAPAGTNAAIAVITFNLAYSNAPYVVLDPANAVTATLAGVTQVYTIPSTTNFILVSGTTGLTAATTYQWHYHVIQ